MRAMSLLVRLNFLLAISLCRSGFAPLVLLRIVGVKIFASLVWLSLTVC